MLTGVICDEDCNNCCIRNMHYSGDPDWENMTMKEICNEIIAEFEISRIIQKSKYPSAFQPVSVLYKKKTPK